MKSEDLENLCKLEELPVSDILRVAKCLYVNDTEIKEKNLNSEKEDASKFNDFPMSILKPISKTSINLTDNYRENFFLDEVFLNDNLSILYHLISF